MRLRFVLSCAAVCLFTATICTAQDPLKVDPKHYKVETENAQVRVLRIHYRLQEKSVMHSHPNSVVTYLSDGTMKMHTPDGKSEELTGKMGQTLFTPAGTHMLENAGDQPFDAVLVELKDHPGPPPRNRKVVNSRPQRCGLKFSAPSQWLAPTPTAICIRAFLPQVTCSTGPTRNNIEAHPIRVTTVTVTNAQEK
jgi:beta-alanine degradation protein BauB